MTPRLTNGPVYTTPTARQLGTFEDRTRHGVGHNGEYWNPLAERMASPLGDA